MRPKPVMTHLGYAPAIYFRTLVSGSPGRRWERTITAYQGHKTLLDYAATEGAIVSLTRSLSEAPVGEGIRVNAVVPCYVVPGE